MQDYRNVVTKPFVSMAFKKTPMEDATACYELQMPQTRRTQPLWQPSCWISLEKPSASHQKWLYNSYNNYQT